MLKNEDFTLEQLAEQYYHISQRIENKRHNPRMYAWSIREAQKELAEIFSIMSQRIPAHIDEQILYMVREANRKPFKPGTRHQHNHSPHITISILYRQQNNTLRCIVWLHDQCDKCVNLTEGQLLRHFTLIQNP